MHRNSIQYIIVNDNESWLNVWPLAPSIDESFSYKLHNNLAYNTFFIWRSVVGLPMVSQAEDNGFKPLLALWVLPNPCAKLHLKYTTRFTVKAVNRFNGVYNVRSPHWVRVGNSALAFLIWEDACAQQRDVNRLGWQWRWWYFSPGNGGLPSSVNYICKVSLRSSVGHYKIRKTKFVSSRPFHSRVNINLSEKSRCEVRILHFVLKA